MAEEFLNRYGPVALVTGASSGIGRGFAEVLAARGFDLVITARRRHRLDDLAQRLAGQHGTATRIIELDLAAVDAPDRLAEQTADLDVGLLVSNAGFPIKGDHAANDPAELTEQLMVNCHAPIQLTRLFIPRLRQRGRGGIILTSSVEGFVGLPYSAAYSSTKALVNSLGEALWSEVRRDGIDVLTLCPGATDTEAPDRCGIDMSNVPDILQPDVVATQALDNLGNGPTIITGTFWPDFVAQNLAAPRREMLDDFAAKERERLGLT